MNWRPTQPSTAHCAQLGITPVQINALREAHSLASDLAMTMTTEGMQGEIIAAMNRLPPQARQAAEARYRASIQRLPGAEEAQARKQWVVDMVGLNGN